MPARVANDTTNAAWVRTVTTPNASVPRTFEINSCATRVATAATAIPTTFWEVPDRMLT